MKSMLHFVVFKMPFLCFIKYFHDNINLAAFLLLSMPKINEQTDGRTDERTDGRTKGQSI